MSFIVTGNKDFLSKKSQFYGIKNIAIKGKTIIKENVVLRGDLRRTGGGNSYVHWQAFSYTSKWSQMLGFFKINV